VNGYNRHVMRTGLLALTALLWGPGVVWAQPAMAVEFYHLDGQGSVLALTDWNASVVESHDYDVFGQEVSPQPGTQTRRFTGKERDTETGWDYFGARYYASRVGRFTTTDPAYVLQENLLDPQRWNKYAYARNNPLKYTDPDGRLIDTIADVGFIGWDVFDMGRSAYRGEGVSGTQWLALGGDVLGAAIPFATGIGAAIRAGSKVEHSVEAARAAERLIEANRVRGVESEARVLRELGEAKNTERVLGREGESIPDYANRTTIGEIKDAKRVTDSRQLRIQREAAANSNRAHVVQTGTNTKVSSTVERQSTVRRREGLGPQ
jgi:RHS repeat-associated protein